MLYFSVKEINQPIRKTTTETIIAIIFYPCRSLLAKRLLSFKKPVLRLYAWVLPLGPAIQKPGCLFAGCCIGFDSSVYSLSPEFLFKPVISFFFFTEFYFVLKPSDAEVLTIIKFRDKRFDIKQRCIVKHVGPRKKYHVIFYLLNLYY